MPEEKDNTLEALEATPDIVERKLGKGADERVFQQKPISFLRKAQIGALVSKLFQRAASEGGPGTVTEILSLGSNLISDDQDLEAAMNDAEGFVMLLASVGTYAPDFITEFFFLVLNVSKKDRQIYLKYIDENEDDGGFSDEEAMDIFKVFYLQNKDRFAELFNWGIGMFRNPIPEEQEILQEKTQDIDTPQAQ